MCCFGRATGREVIFLGGNNDIIGADGNVYTLQGRAKDGVIYVNPNNGTYISNQVLAEEFIHTIEGTKSYGEFVSFIRDLANNTEGIDAEAEKAEINDLYTAAGVEFNLEREFTAQMAAKLLFNDPESVEYLVKNRQSVAGRFFDFLSQYSAKLTGKDEKATVMQARRLLSQALRESEGMEREILRSAQNDSIEDEGSYSINREYENDIDFWKREGMSDDEVFDLGTSGDVLQGLGAIESDIYMLGDKIKEIINKHPEMTLEEIKKIPQILENPVLILKSQNVGRGSKQNTRLVIFGNIKAQDGKPMLTVLDLRPIENNFVIDDMQKVSSAYTKDNPEDFVRNSLIVYADKKRTTKLLKSIGFQTPIELQQSGYIGSISYEGQNVNINGEEFSKIFSEGNGKDGSNSIARKSGATMEEPEGEWNVPENGETVSERAVTSAEKTLKKHMGIEEGERQPFSQAEPDSSPYTREPLEGEAESIDEVTAEMTAQHRARFATKSKAEFDALPDTDKLKAAEVRGISGSVGLYGQTEIAKEQKQAEKTTGKKASALPMLFLVSIKIMLSSPEPIQQG